jgi:trehalose 6-phosphate phosphatase
VILEAASHGLSGVKSAVGKNARVLISPLRDSPGSSALVVDIDGTIAPIVTQPQEASVPSGTRELLIRLQVRYALVACASGRRAVDARRVVGIDSIEYIGNHGLERLRPGSFEAETHVPVDSDPDQVRSFTADSYSSRLRDLGVRLEDKEAIWSFHWREAPDEPTARAELELVAADAQSRGLVAHWGRKVLEVRPPVPFDKGTALERLLDDGDFERALYAGDDTTDLDCFRKLRELLSSGRLTHALCVGVSSDEGPPEIADEADLMVDGPNGMRELLAALL